MCEIEGGEVMSKSKTVSFPVCGILGLIFITLKLAEIGAVATWSWLWVLSPFWIPIAFVLTCFIVIFLLAMWVGK